MAGPGAEPEPACHEPLRTRKGPPRERRPFGRRSCAHHAQFYRTENL